MKPHVGPKVVQDGAVAKHHMNTNEITQTFLKRRFFFIGSLRAVNRYGHSIKRYGVLEEVNNFGKITATGQNSTSSGKGQLLHWHCFSLVHGGAEDAVGRMNSSVIGSRSTWICLVVPSGKSNTYVYRRGSIASSAARGEIERSMIT